ncbi:MAG: glycosyltransferase [Anaerolineae bacterium]|nr:glycosyltransferase [Candidatus Roseilinea sp.]MDW8451130.1 glycosyltransferase [Anaerolineae bacterium]
MSQFTQPRVSIAIPTYQQERWLGEAIASALDQDYPHLEVLVCDDASPDATPEVVQAFMHDHRLRYVRHAHNLGRVANYRYALHHASGDWLLMLDGDDYLIDPHYIRDAVAQLQSHSDVVLVFGGCRITSSAQRVRDCCETRQAWECTDGFSYFRRWHAWLGIPHQAALYNRELARRLDFYRFDIISSDWESLRRLILHGKILIHGAPVVVWRKHDHNASLSPGVAQRIADLQSIEGPYRYALDRGFDRKLLQQWRRRTIADYAINHMRISLRANRLDDFWKMLSYLSVNDEEAYHAALRRLVYHPHLVLIYVISFVNGGRLPSLLLRAWHHIAPFD